MKKFGFTALTLSAALIFSQAAIMPRSANPRVSAESAGVNCIYADERREVISGATYTLMIRLSGKYVTAASNGNVHQWQGLNNASQQWVIKSTGDGNCKLLSAENTSLAMTVETADGGDGSNIFLSEDKDSAQQLFRLNRTDDAYYITACCSGNETALDVYDISHENGANINLWSYWGGEGQKYYIRPVNSKYTLLRGDLSLDGELNATDLSLMKRGIAMGFDRNASAIADMNGDGGNGNDDIRLLAQYLLGKNPQIPDYLCEIEYKNEAAAYLFAYFQGNAPEQERMCYAISTDGYHYNALNGGNYVWKSSSGTECIRDPYIFLGNDNCYHLVATDMRSSLGWSSNRNIISAKSTDLIHWTDEAIIEIADKYASMSGADRAWAPQVIYDPAKNSYMLYWAARTPASGMKTIMYYAYTSDLKNLDTEPALLFAPISGDDAIDSDIILQDGTYYMYYKNETNKRIYLATAQNASGPYTEIKQVSEGTLGVEGPNIYNIIGTNRWVLMSDVYGNGYYTLQETTDLKNFTTLDKSAYSFDFTPRHGYVIPISAAQYGSLVSAFPSDSIKTQSIGVDEVSVRVGAGASISLPRSVSVNYSDGGAMDFGVEWNQSELSAIDTSRAGTYTISGKVMTPDYDNPLIKERADPYIVKGDDGYYYFTASYPAYGSVNKGYDRIILRRSKTVAGLASAEEKTLWTAHASGIMAKHIWAPEMHFIGGKWYIYFAAGNSNGIWNIRPYVLRCDGDPYTSAWTECGQMQASAGDSSSFADFSLDMTYFEHKGKHYVIWAEIKGDSSLFMAEINPDEPYKLINKPILLTKPEFSWELVNNRVNEGACVLKTDNKIFVFFSASGTGSEYCMGRLEANIDADLMNISSWKKLSKPVLSTSDLSGESGPGHNSFVTDEDGNLLLIYHARPSSHSTKECGTYSADSLYDPCRHTRVKSVYISADGTPIVNMSESQILADKLKTVTATVTVVG